MTVGPRVMAVWVDRLTANEGRRAGPRRAALRGDRLIPAGFIALAAIPIVAGVARLVMLGSGAELTPDNARFVSAPLPVVLHIIGRPLTASWGRSSSLRGSGGTTWSGTAGRGER